MKKTKIFYVFGYDDSPQSELFHQLKEGLDSSKYELITDYYAQYNPVAALKDLNEYIKDNKINVVIGENLGAYLTAFIEGDDLVKILIDPIIDPKIELAEYKVQQEDEKGNIIELPMVPKHIIDYYSKFDEKLDIQNFCCIVTNDSSYYECKDLCSTIIRSDNPVQTIIETFKMAENENI